MNFINDNGDTTPEQKNARLGVQLETTYVDANIDQIVRVETPPTGWQIILKAAAAAQGATTTAAVKPNP